MKVRRGITLAGLYFLPFSTMRVGWVPSAFATSDVVRARFEFRCSTTIAAAALPKSNDC